MGGFRLEVLAGSTRLPRLGSVLEWGFVTAAGQLSLLTALGGQLLRAAGGAPVLLGAHHDDSHTLRGSDHQCCSGSSVFFG